MEILIDIQSESVNYEVGDMIEINGELFFIVDEYREDKFQFILRSFKGGQWRGYHGYADSIDILIGNLREDDIKHYPKKDYALKLVRK